MLTPTQTPIRPYLHTANRVGWSLAVFFGLFTVISGTVEIVFAAIGLTDPVVRAIYAVLSSLAYMLPFFLAARFFSRERRKKPSGILRQRVRTEVRLPAAFPLLILATLGLNTAASYVNGFICQAIGYVSYGPVDASMYDIPGAVILYMTTALAPAFAEEYLFRGIIYGHLRPFGQKQAIFISALMFALMHQNLAQLFYTFIAGILLAIMYEYTGSIWCGVLCHLLNNELAVIYEVLVYGAFGEAASLVMLVWDLVLIVIGVASAVILILLNRRRKAGKQTTAEADPCVFGRTADEAEHWDVPADRYAVRRALRTPGMLFFTILSVIAMLSTYALMTTINAGGYP